MFEEMRKYIARGLMAGLCFLWLVFGVLTLSGNIILAILMMVNGVCFGVFAFVYKTGKRLLKWLLYIFIAVNIILTFTDQMGVYDWLVLVLYVALLFFVIIEYADK